LLPKSQIVSVTPNCCRNSESPHAIYIFLFMLIIYCYESEIGMNLS